MKNRGKKIKDITRSKNLVLRIQKPIKGSSESRVTIRGPNPSEVDEVRRKLLNISGQDREKGNVSVSR